MQDCIFCKIVAGDISNYTIYEDELVLSFLDISPTAKGHSVVIPKKHGATIFDFSTEELSSVMNGVKNTSTKIDKALNPDGYNIGCNHGEAGGQSVPHLHFHIIPRYVGDGGGSMHSIVTSPGEETVEEVFEKLKK